MTKVIDVKKVIKVIKKEQLQHMTEHYCRIEYIISEKNECINCPYHLNYERNRCVPSNLTSLREWVK